MIKGKSNVQIIGNNNQVVNNHIVIEGVKEVKVVKKIEKSKTDPNIHITSEQAYILSELTRDIHDFCVEFQIRFRDNIEIPNTRRYIWGCLNKKMKVPRYELITQEKFKEAEKHLKFLKKQAIGRLKEESATRYKAFIVPHLKKLFHIKSKGGRVSGCETLIDFAILKTKISKKSIELYCKDDLSKIYTALINVKG